MKLNQVNIIGRIVEEDLSYIPGSGTPVLKLRVLIDDGYYDTKKSEYVKRNIYRTVKYINKVAESLGVRKDDWVFVSGSMATDQWEDRDGDKKYSDYVRATVVMEVPDPWELRDSKGGNRGGRDDRDSGRDDRDRGRGRDDHDRGRGGRDSRDRDDRDRGRGRDERRDDRRDYRSGRDDIPF